MLDPTKVIEVVQAHAHHKLTSGSETREATNLAQRKIADALSQEVNKHLDDYLDQIEAQFIPAAEAYAEAVQALPREFDSKDVTGWDPKTFEAYSWAKQANTAIEAAKTWLLNLERVLPSETFNNAYASEFLILAP